MKQGLNFIMPVRFGIDLWEVEQIEFIFKQGNITKEYYYPSDEAYMMNDRTVALVWSKEDTYRFTPNVDMEMDTRISLVNSDYNPETEIVKVKFNRTLFEEDIPQ